MLPSGKPAELDELQRHALLRVHAPQAVSEPAEELRIDRPRSTPGEQVVHRVPRELGEASQYERVRRRVPLDRAPQLLRRHAEQSGHVLPFPNRIRSFGDSAAELALCRGRWFWHGPDEFPGQGTHMSLIHFAWLT